MDVGPDRFACSIMLQFSNELNYYLVCSEVISWSRDWIQADVYQLIEKYEERKLL